MIHFTALFIIVVNYEIANLSSYFGFPDKSIFQMSFILQDTPGVPQSCKVYIYFLRIEPLLVKLAISESNKTHTFVYQAGPNEQFILLEAKLKLKTTHDIEGFKTMLNYINEDKKFKISSLYEIVSKLPSPYKTNNLNLTLCINAIDSSSPCISRKNYNIYYGCNFNFRNRSGHFSFSLDITSNSQYVVSAKRAGVVNAKNIGYINSLYQFLIKTIPKENVTVNQAGNVQTNSDPEVLKNKNPKKKKERESRKRKPKKYVYTKVAIYCLGLVVVIVFSICRYRKNKKEKSIKKRVTQNMKKYRVTEIRE